MTRYTSHGKKVHLENLRRDMTMIIDRPISSMDKFEGGIAEFENAIKLDADAYGEPYNEDDAKNMDLMKI